MNLKIWPPNTTGNVIRLAAVILFAANLVAVYFVFRPWGGSAEELRQQAQDLRLQIRQHQGSLDRTKKLVEKIQAGRTEGDDFLDDYFLPRRTAYSTVLAELTKSAVDSKIKPKEAAFAVEPIEGSDTLSMMTISANYEGKYDDLIRFVNLIDRSDNLLIIEGLNATPQQGSAGILNVTLKLDTFVREDAAI